MPLRFPNPGSDMARLVNTFRLVHLGTKAQGEFELDDMSRVMTDGFQASSRGAVGAAALERSTEDDRSRDPLYNQSKMYSEVFRMLGWIRPGVRRLAFRTTTLGEMVAEDLIHHPDLMSGVFRQSLLGITFPNPNTENVGVANHRPFRWLLLVSAELDGVITRHEMILSLLATVDDRETGSFDRAVERVRRARGSRKNLMTAVTRTAAEMGIQVNTLENYTRFPVGVLKSTSIGWATPERVTGLYERPVEALRLSPLGLATSESLRAAVDIREADLQAFSLTERAWFANYAHCAMLISAGVDDPAINEDLSRAARKAEAVLKGLRVAGPGTFLYSPFQQAPNDVLLHAEGVEADRP